MANGFESATDLTLGAARAGFTPDDDRCILLSCGVTSRAFQACDVGSTGLSALRTPCDLVGTTAPGWNSGTPGSQSFRAACSRAFTLAEESSRLVLPIQPQVQRAWFLRRMRITTTTPRPPLGSPIAARSPASEVWRQPGLVSKAMGLHHLPNWWAAGADRCHWTSLCAGH
jgi:hypothetical protein